jgi:hypothetical protein
VTNISREEYNINMTFKINTKDSYWIHTAQSKVKRYHFVKTVMILQVLRILKRFSGKNVLHKPAKQLLVLSEGNNFIFHWNHSLPYFELNHVHKPDTQSNVNTAFPGNTFRAEANRRTP